jgi:hypothetical protein
MKRVFNIQIQRADNGFIVITQNDEPGMRMQKHVATSEDDAKEAVKGFAEHIFDVPPPKAAIKPDKPA